MYNIEKLTSVDWKVIFAFAENDMNITQTAAKTFMHWNNVNYHLKKVEQITGLNPKKFSDLIKLLYLKNNADK